jgi:hypothetical protein
MTAGLIRGMLTAALLVAFTIAAIAADAVLIEDWSKIDVGTRGVPPGWQKQNWGSPKYDFVVENDGGSKVLHLRSEDDSSTISKEVTVDVKQFPILQWRWKVAVLPRAGDARKKETDDEAAQLYVTFPRFPSAVRSRVIGYIWDTAAPAGATFPSQKVGTVTFVVVRSGNAELGRWLTETRNVYDDYKRIYREDPAESVGAVAISINSQNGHSRAESFFGEIVFRKP